MMSCGDDFATGELGPARVQYPGEWVQEPLDGLGWDQSVVMRPRSLAPDQQELFVQLSYSRGGRSGYEAQIGAAKDDVLPTGVAQIVRIRANGGRIVANDKFGQDARPHGIGALQRAIAI